MHCTGRQLAKAFRFLYVEKLVGLIPWNAMIVLAREFDMFDEVRFVHWQYGWSICNSNGSLFMQEVAKKVGEAIGKACLEKGISKVAFDRGGFVYHGRIKALADAAREAGLEF